MAHYQRKHTTPPKGRLTRRLDPPGETGAYQQYLRRIPAKKPKGYCIKLKGPHVFEHHSQLDWHSFILSSQKKGAIVHIPTRYEVWRCRGCEKNRFITIPMECMTNP